MKIVIINGPNLNLLGIREPEKYGITRFEDYLEALKSQYPDCEIEYFQSNVEGEIINKLHEVGFSVDGIVLNAGGYTHTSVAIADAVAAIEVPVVEVHITNIYAREEERRVSLLSRACVGVISGFGLRSYDLAMEFFCAEKKY
ncbi:MAG: type II 3-dehydroquinate dehydratase [Paludibacteraceae bacterium]|nr:type II 3-dehydroquinate dehydratase [Paludibacteraceae bacterium]